MLRPVVLSVVTLAIVATTAEAKRQRFAGFTAGATLTDFGGVSTSGSCFAVAPEIGLIFPVDWHLKAHLSARYNYGFRASNRTVQYFTVRNWVGVAVGGS